ncbi:hypothetical protein ACFW94_45620, partial [Streptomyces sp. NPDC059460]
PHPATQSARNSAKRICLDAAGPSSSLKDQAKYERRARGLVQRRTVTGARFVRLYGAHGYDQR